MVCPWSLFSAFLFLFYCCQNNNTNVAGFSNCATKPLVFYKNDILNRERDMPRYAEALQVAGAGAQQIDLAARTKVPDFIDANGHVGIVADYKQFAFWREYQEENKADIMKLMEKVVQQYRSKGGRVNVIDCSG